MKIKDLSKEELTAMSYANLAYLILQENDKKMKIKDLFQKICNLLELGENVFENKIADFFELLTTDRKFIMLEDGSWDLRVKHSHKIKIETDDDIEENLESTSDIEDIAELVDEANENINEDIFYEGEDTDDEGDDDLKDLVIMDEDEENPSSL